MDKLTALATLVRSYLTPANRKALYVILGAVGAIAVAVGWASDAQVADLVGRIGAVLDALALLFLAAPHVDTSTPTGAPAEEYDARHDGE